MIVLDVLRVVFGLLLTLLVPGFLLNLLLFKNQKLLDRFFLAAPLSIVVDTVLGLTLGFNNTLASITGGITPHNVFIYLSIVSLVLLILIVIFKSYKNLKADVKKQDTPGGNSTLFYVSIILSLLILVYTALLDYINLSSIYFHLLYVSNIILISYLMLFKKLNVKKTLFLIIFYVICLQLIIPIRLPLSVASNYSDGQYEIQIVNNIIRTGAIDFNFGTGYSAGYVYHPVLEVLSSIINFNTSLSPEIIIKYLGIFLNIFTLYFFYKFLRNYFDERISLISLLVGGSCFNFIYFQAFTVHQSIALLYIFIFLYSFRFEEFSYKLILLSSILMITLSHHFSSIVFLVILVLTLISYIILKLFYKVLKKEFYISWIKKLILPTAILIIFVSFWLIMFAQPFTNEFVSLMNVVKDKVTPQEYYTIAYETPVIKDGVYTTKKVVNEVIVDNNPSQLQEIQEKYGVNTKLTIEKNIKLPGFNFVLYQGSMGKNDYIRFVGNLSLIIFAILTFFGVLYVFINWSKPYFEFLPYSLAAIIMFGIFTLIWSLNFNFVSNLYSRSFIYLYFFSAVFVTLSITKTILIFNKKFFYYFSLLLLFFVLLGSWYYNTYNFYYDNLAPLNVEDVRLNLNAFKDAGIYSKNLPTDTLWGNKPSFSFIGSYGEKIFYYVPPVGYKNFIMTQLDYGSYVVITKNNYKTENFKEVYHPSDIIYNSNEILIIRLGDFRK